jgi:hypothetical protein
MADLHLTTVDLDVLRKAYAILCRFNISEIRTHVAGDMCVVIRGYMGQTVHWGGGLANAMQACANGVVHPGCYFERPRPTRAERQAAERRVSAAFATEVRRG